MFVVGDHRKISNDSRDELGLIHISDIDHFIPFETQTDLQARWRDPSQDLSNEDLPILDLDEYLKSINTLRQQAGVKPLTYVSQLEQSALTRATIILESGDLSFDGETSGVSTRIAMQRAGYSNIIWGEIPILGYYTAQELAQAVASSPSHKEFLTNSEFEDLGISVRIGEMNNCPTQIVVQHFGGYRPPDYSEADKSGWRDTVDSAEKSLASWIELREAGEVYENNKDDIEKIISLLNERVQISRRISAKVISNQWLSTADQNDISRFSSIGTEVTGLISAFNRKMRGE